MAVVLLSTRRADKSNLNWGKVILFDNATQKSIGEVAHKNEEKNAHQDKFIEIRVYDD